MEKTRMGNNIQYHAIQWQTSQDQKYILNPQISWYFRPDDRLDIMRYTNKKFHTKNTFCDFRIICYCCPKYRFDITWCTGKRCKTMKWSPPHTNKYSRTYDRRWQITKRKLCTDGSIERPQEKKLHFQWSNIVLPHEV